MPNDRRGHGFQDGYMKTALRLPRDLHAKVLESARESGRSLNSEFIARIASSFEVATAAELSTVVRDVRAMLDYMQAGVTIPQEDGFS